MSNAGLPGLVADVRRGQRRAVGRALSLVENNSPQLPELMRLLLVDSGRAQVVGLTGPPGVGKSTLTARLAQAWRAVGHRVGILAVDPSSPFSGGALLGDRVRMQAHATDREVIIRSMASRGHLGGLAEAAPQALRVFDAAGCDVIIVETVGVGQSEVEIGRVCDTTVVMLAPGMGDAVQAAKAGVLEIGDLYVVNKSDRPGAQEVVRDLRTMIALTERADDAWKPQIVSAVAEQGAGVEELIMRISDHRQAATVTGTWKARRIRRTVCEVQALTMTRLYQRLQVATPNGERLTQLAEAVYGHELDAHAAAEQLVVEVLGG